MAEKNSQFDEEFARQHGRLTFRELTLTERTMAQYGNEKLTERLVEKTGLGPWQREYICSTRQEGSQETRFPQPYGWVIRQTHQEDGKPVSVEKTVDASNHGISPFGVYDPRLFGWQIESGHEPLLDVSREYSWGVEQRIGVWTLKNLDNIAKLLKKDSKDITNEDLRSLGLRMGIYGSKEALISPYNQIFVSPTTAMQLCSNPLLLTARDYLELMEIHLNVLTGRDFENGNWSSLVVKQGENGRISISLDNVISHLNIAKSHLEGFAETASEVGYETSVKASLDLVTRYKRGIEDF